MTEQHTGRPALQADATAKAVARNLTRLRKARGFTTRGLSAELRKLGRPISGDAICKMENVARPDAKHFRRVDVDDLMALAIALGVSPSGLLLPPTDGPSDTVEVSGLGAVSAVNAWDWIDGKRPLKMTPGSEQTQMLEYDLYSRPANRRIHAMSAAPRTPVAPPTRTAHGTDDTYPYGGDYDAGREYTLTCYCGREFTGDTDGPVEADFDQHMDDVDKGLA